MSRPIAMHTITQANAAHVLYVMGLEGGRKPGELPRKLIEAALSCDDYNMERLERGFEGLVSAVRMFHELPDGLEQLRRIAMPGPF